MTILAKSPYPASRKGPPGSTRQLQIRAWAAMICLLLFAFLAWQLRVNGLAAFDNAVTGWVRAYMSPMLTHGMLLISDLGALPFIAALSTLSAAYLFARRKWGDGLGVAAASLGSWLLESQLKIVFHRPRPDLPHLTPVTGYSFPSAHATVTAAVFLTLALVYCRHPASATGRAMMLPGAALIILLVGISRVYLGVHYPSDVLAGWAAGCLWALAIDFLLGLNA